MIVQSLSLADFRNYGLQTIEFSRGVNIFYGDNAQGKTNILEAIYLCSTNKSYRGSRDRDMIRFGCEEAHLKLIGEKREIPYRIDMHLKKNKSKGIAVNSVPIRKASELLGLLHVVFFSPEDLQLIKNGPSERRRFLDMELCQLDKIYMQQLAGYNRCLVQRNTLLKEAGIRPDSLATLDVWDKQLCECGRQIIRRRAQFVQEIAPYIRDIHKRLSGEREELDISYEPNVEENMFEPVLEKNRDRDLRMKQTMTGPHRDDIRFLVKRQGSDQTTDIRTFGSQGQQRTAALSVKMAEIELVKQKTGDTPVLLLDDVLSELDSSRQTYLLDGIRDIQTMITCTGLDDLVSHRFHMDRIFRVENGTVKQENGGTAVHGSPDNVIH
mgnify:FL=1